MNEERPYLQIPIPSAEEAKLYEEWLREQQKEEASKEESSRVIIIEL
tara:strand:- start:542 stop:682 length:141 start_codon:yes stop_codon:yes gene_type:complete